MGFEEEVEIRAWKLLGCILLVKKVKNPKFEVIWSIFEGSTIFGIWSLEELKNLKSGSCDLVEIEGWNLLGFVLYIKENLNPKFELIWSWFEGNWIFELFLCSWRPSNLHKEEDSPKGYLIQKLPNKVGKSVCGPK